MTLSTRIAVMNEGVIQQVGRPREVYEYPKTRFVADFIGSVNLFEGPVKQAGGDGAPLLVEAPEVGIDIAVEGEGLELAAGREVAVALRPEKITISKQRPSDADNMVAGKVDEIAYQGGISIYQVRLATDRLVKVTQPNLARMADRPIDWEEDVWLSWSRAAGVVLTA